MIILLSLCMECIYELYFGQNLLIFQKISYLYFYSVLYFHQFPIKFPTYTFIRNCRLFGTLEYLHLRYACNLLTVTKVQMSFCAINHHVHPLMQNYRFQHQKYGLTVQWRQDSKSDIIFIFIKDQLILKFLFSVFTFFQKTNKNKSASSKVEFVCSFVRRSVSLKK